MNKYDWKIHKILDETKRVYVYPARGSAKTYTQLEIYADLMAQNKDIKVIRAEDVKKTGPWKPKPEPVLDYDLVDRHYHHLRYTMFGDYMHEHYRDYSFKPDTYKLDKGDCFGICDMWSKDNPWLKDSNESNLD